MGIPVTETQPTHDIVWTIEHGMLRGAPRCHAAPDADCRLTCTQGCEEWAVERDDHGPFHRADNYRGGESGYDVVEERHDMEPLRDGDCNVVLFLDTFDSIQELGGPHVDLGALPILPEWQGDHYTWTPATPARD